MPQLFLHQIINTFHIRIGESLSVTYTVDLSDPPISNYDRDKSLIALYTLSLLSGLNQPGINMVQVCVGPTTPIIHPSDFILPNRSFDSISNLDTPLFHRGLNSWKSANRKRLLSTYPAIIPPIDKNLPPLS